MKQQNGVTISAQWFLNYGHCFILFYQSLEKYAISANF